MGKSKRNRDRRRDDAMRWPAPSLEQANADVRNAERVLLEARRRAAQAAEAARGAEQRRREHLSGYGAAHRAARDRVRRAHLPVDLDDAGGRAPEDQGAAFFNRPGDYYLAKFSVGGHVNGGPSGVTFVAETVLKASEDEFDYLLEVLRQIRGGFGEKCRIELYRTHTVEQAPDEPGHFPEPEIRPTIDDGPPIPMSEFRLGERYSSADAGHDAADQPVPTLDERNDQIPPWLRGAPPWVQEVTRDLTREELQAQLPGMTRAEVAAELGKRPEDIGGNVYTGDLEREKIAAEFGVPVESLQPISMSNGGYAYSVVPQPPPPEGRHAKSEETQP